MGKERQKYERKEKKVMLSTKDLVFNEQLARKLVDQYMSLHIIEEVVSTNTVKLKLPTIMRIHLVVSLSQVVKYRKLVRKQRVEEPELVEVDGEEE